MTVEGISERERERESYSVLRCEKQSIKNSAASYCDKQIEDENKK